MPASWAPVSTDCNGVVIETIKKAEDDDSVIVRLYEAYNKKADAVIKTGFDFCEAYLCDLMENNTKKLENDGRSVRIKASNYEIITLKFVV